MSKPWSTSTILTFVLTILLNIGHVESFGCFIAFWEDQVQDIDREAFFPLRAMDANVVIVDGIAEVSVVQYFETIFTPLGLTFDIPNSWNSRYEIPIDEEAAIHTFIATYDDRVIEGIVKSDDEAQQEFDEAIEDGKPAFLGEQASAGVFKIEFGNIPLEKLLKVELVYVTEVQSRDRNTLRFTIPASLAPELNPRGGDTEGLPYRNGVFALNLEASSSRLGGVTGVSSPTHAITVTDTGITSSDQQPGKIVELIDTDTQRRDITVVIEVAAVQDVHVAVYQEPLDDGSAALMVSLFPDTSTFELDSLLTEVIVLVDRSGSMGGEKIEQTRQALSYFLENLPEGSRFNFVGFGSTFEYLFTESQLIDDPDAFNSGISYVNLLNANFGSTDIFSPIVSILESSPTTGYQRVLLVLTDGEVTNTEDVVDYIATNRGSTRCFSIGIGEADRELINGIARSGAGTAEYVDSNELSSIQSAMQNQVEIALQAGFLGGLTINWGGLSSTEAGVVAPYGISTVFANRRTLIYLLTPVPAPGDTTDPVPSQIDITAFVGGLEEVTYSVPREAFIDSSELAPGTRVIAKMGAREAIRDLEEGRSVFHTESNPDSEAIKNEIIEIGVRYQITSSETTFIAIDNFGWTSRNSEDGTDDVDPPALPGFGLCFSAQSTVMVKGKGEVAMDSLQIGDLVEVGRSKFSHVYSFGHHNVESPTEYLQLHHGGNKLPLEISEDHMVFVARLGAVPAGKVSVGDELVLRDNELSVVTKISSVRRLGAFAPFTKTGTIIVSGVKASSYVSLQDGSGSFSIGGIDVLSMHWLAHAYQAPHRLACLIGMCKSETYTESGISHWVHRPLLAFTWLYNQHPIVANSLSVPALLVGVALNFVEVAVMNPLVVLLMVLTFIRLRGNKMKGV